MPALDSDRFAAAAERLGGWLAPTPQRSLPGSSCLELKLEMFQPTGSFKVRGYFAAALALAPEVRSRGLMTVSAGNAAVACAYVAHRLGIPCRVLMVASAPAAKVQAVRALGAATTLMPREELFAWMSLETWRQAPEHFIHPHLDLEFAAGVGTLGREIMDCSPGTRRIVVAVGGGGLASGLGAALKASHPDLELIGVQSDGYPLWPLVMAQGAEPELVPDTIADGTVAPYNAVMKERLKALVDRWILVPESHLRASILELAWRAGVVAEGAGALPYAAADQLDDGTPSVLVLSGGNIDRGLLARLLLS